MDMSESSREYTVMLNLNLITVSSHICGFLRVKYWQNTAIPNRNKSLSLVAFVADEGYPGLSDSQHDDYIELYSHHLLHQYTQNNYALNNNIY